MLNEVSSSDIIKIIEDRIPLGKFFCRTDIHKKENENLFVAVDNSTGCAWTEEFSNYQEVEKWLNSNGLE